MMLKSFLRLCSILLVIVMVANTLPLQVFTEELQKENVNALVTDTVPTKKQIMEEIPEKRTEYSKEFQLNNGLFMAVVYPEAVHYQKDGQWEDIDNTLKLSTDGTYTNAAGVWDVRFPQQLSKSNSVSITKDGYTLSFAMAGEIVSSGELMRSGGETLTVSGAQISSAKVEAIDFTAQKAAAEHPETVLKKLQSRLTYNGVYQKTDVIYDLDSNKVKESVVLKSYNSALRGYRYTLQVGDLLPVLEENGDIHIYTPDKKTIVMTMPAPYLLDSNYAHNDDIQVTLTGSGSTYTLTYLLPRAWLADEERAWPVILDPVVEANISALNMQDNRVMENGTGDYKDYVLEAGYDVDNGKTRSYLKFEELPALTSSDVVVGATLQLCQPSTRTDPNMTLCVEVHKVTGTWESSNITWATQPTFTLEAEDYCLVPGTPGYNGWVVTDIVRSWYADGNNGLMIKAPDAVENAGTANWMQFYSSDSDYKPALSITFRNNNGLESYWDYTTSSAGRAGTGYVNNFTGNLVWVHSDIGFGGNRMPVSINHVYNANDALSANETNNSDDTGGNFFGLGYGWRTNFHQRIYQWNINDDYYIWEDADGTDHYFIADSEGKYKDEDGLELELTIGSNGTSKYTLTDKNGNTSHFDTYGRLRKQQNNQATKSSIDITYYSTTQLITCITDGIGRRYLYMYEDGLLNKIQYMGTGSTELSYVEFVYSGAKLTKIKDKDGKISAFGYTGSLLTSATDIDGYELTYTYNTPAEEWQPYRVIKISEYDGTQGGELNIAYGHNQTKFTDHNDNVEIVQFNDFGNTVSVQDDEGHASFAQYALNTDKQAQNNTDATKKGNQLRLSSKLQNTVGNRLQDSSFENGNSWYSNSSSLTVTRSTATAYSGSYSLKITSTTENNVAALATGFSLQKGETVTFSAYVKTEGAYAIIALQTSGDYATYTGSHISPNSNWTRARVSYTNTTNETKTISPILFITDPGVAYMDCVQVEEAVTPSRFNLIENGDFSVSGSPAARWTNNSNCESTETRTTTTAAAPQLDGNVLKVVGQPTLKKRIYQDVKISGNAGDSFVLSGWAKGNSAPLAGFDDRGRAFCIHATIHYTDGATKDFVASFNPDCTAWQYASVPIVAEKAYSSITVSVRYYLNVNTAYFDGIQLYKEAYGSSYTYDEDGNVISVVDLQKQETTYEYTENKLTKELVNGTTKMSYTYDQWNNVLTASESANKRYIFAYDTYGNNTSVISYSVEGLIATYATYSNDGNRLVSTEDSLGNLTTYSYNANTNVLEWVQYPEDTTETRTNYTYDSMYRLSTASLNTDTGKTLSAGYTYTNDQISSINTGSTTYNFTYGNFGQRTAVKVGTQTLASYVYTSDRNRYLDRLDYGNGDKVQYTYDEKGRVIQEAYEDGATVTYQYDNDGALATVKDSETGIKTTYYYDFTNRTMKYVESGTGHSLSVSYGYDTLNKMTQMVRTLNGVTRTTNYTYDSLERLTGTETGGIGENIVYDTAGRVYTQKTSASGQDILTHTYDYTPRNSTELYLITSQIATDTISTAGYTKTFTYTYDKNGNIATVSDGTYTTHYFYDSANQLTTESNEARGYILYWTYDDAGNILTRKKRSTSTGNITENVTYTYGNSQWGDLLTGYNGKTFTYDAVGNLLSDGEWTYTWKHGRQLESMTKGNSTYSFVYNADGMRIRTDLNGSPNIHYVYDGSTLIQMRLGNHTLDFTYGTNGPVSVTWNGTTYYYVTNIQGDVISIVDANGTAVVNYSYDAWGNVVACSGSLLSSLGSLNPLLYRGYVYDQLTGLYYLQSRYYNSKIGRFINADAFVSTGQGFVGNNMFAYCLNNPVMYKDQTGFLTLEAIATAAGSAVGVAGSVSLLPVVLVVVVVAVLFNPTVQDTIADGFEYIEAAIIPQANEYKETITDNTRAKHRSASEILDRYLAKKPVNLPSWKKLKVDMEHIKSGHTPGGPRNPKGLKGVFYGLTANEILKAIHEAYNNSSKLHSQMERILIEGYSYTYEIWIEMWVNVKDLIIETAYPK